MLKYLNAAFELLGDDVNLNDDRLGMLDVPGVGPDQLSPAISCIERDVDIKAMANAIRPTVA